MKTKNEYSVPRGAWGDAIKYTRIDEEGKMWVGNGEYESQVNYCPVTGDKAPVQMKCEEKYYTYRDKITNYKLYENE